MNQSDIDYTIAATVLSLLRNPWETIAFLIIAIGIFFYVLHLILGPSISNTIKGIFGFLFQFIAFGLRTITIILKAITDLLSLVLDKKERGRR